MKLLNKIMGKQQEEKKPVEEDMTPAQYKVRPDDPAMDLPYYVSKFVDFGGTRDKGQINTMSYVVAVLYKSRPEWFPRLSDLQPVPRGMPIKQHVSTVGRLVYDKGINDLVFRSFLRESDTLEALIRQLDSATNRRTLYKRKF